MRRQETFGHSFEVILGLFPVLYFIVLFFVLQFCLEEQSIYALLIFILFTYLFPPALCRFILKFYPVTEGFTVIGKANPGHPWMATYFTQSLFNSFPLFERILRLVPGLYSVWLRLWGAKIGRKVVWTPGTEIVDRPFLSVGDRVFFGNQTYVSAHAIKKKNKSVYLYFSPIVIANDAFLGFRCVLGPGAKVLEAQFVAAGEVVGLGARKGEGDGEGNGGGNGGGNKDE